MIEKKRAGSDYMAIFSSLAYVVILLGVILLLPLLCLPFYPEERDQMQCFIYPGVLSIFIGYLIRLFTGKQSLANLKRNSGALMVLIIWAISSFIGAFPFYMTGEYTFTQALFESVSGFTTTSFTVTNVETASHMILLYRSILNLFGGVGLVLILTTVLSNIYGMQLFSAEGHTYKLSPSLRKSASIILRFYVVFIVGGSILYILCGIEPFDAINTSISAVSTGGFSTHANSMAYWCSDTTANSVFIDIITIVLMLLGATNFMSSLLLVKGDFKSFIKNGETKVLLGLFLVSLPITFAALLKTGICETIPSALDNAVFQVVSIMTTTGFTTIPNFLSRCSFAIVPIILLMIVGGQGGSTACGIKAYRADIAIRSVFYDLRDKIDSNRVIRSREIWRFGKSEKITTSEQSQNSTYILLYMVFGLCGTFALMCCGYGFEESFIDFFSTLGTVGVSSGIVGPDMSNTVMWIFIVGMLFARLEAYTILLGILRLAANAIDRREQRREAK